METATLHKTSDVLANRHPFFDRTFNPLSPTPTQVAVAYGERRIVKLNDLLKCGEVRPEARVEALNHLMGQLSSQEAKLRTVSEGTCAACTALLSDDTPRVRALAARVLSSLCLVLQGRAEASKAGALPLLAAMLTDPYAQARQGAAEALHSISDATDGTEMITDSPGCIEAICDAIGMPSLERPLVGTLCNLTRLLRATEAIIERGPVPRPLGLRSSGRPPHPCLCAPSSPEGSLLELAERHVAGPIATTALSALWNMMQCAKGKAACVACNGVPRLCVLVRDALPAMPAPAASWEPFPDLGLEPVARLDPGLSDTALQVQSTPYNAPLGLTDGYGANTVRALSTGCLAMGMLSLEGRHAAIGATPRPPQWPPADPDPLHPVVEPPAPLQCTNRECVPILVTALLSREPFTASHSFRALAHLCELPAGRTAVIEAMQDAQCPQELLTKVLEHVGRGASFPP
ncbi:hypothetical protein PAPYR_10960 [Paratrimastix pyriformis]|uniref:Armadillo repeat-containing protein 8 n=1 Tax=Paratrimastix pyriformis TaxID=342808 RepID=A0ABQ8U7G4_9EUKA|nr:hypothetical protein PAPYR_10960 [Paratrimastix pyriformis]